MKFALSACLLLAVSAFAGDLPLSQPAHTIVPATRFFNLSIAVPEGGEVFVAGQPQTFVFGGRVRLKTILVELSRDGGLTFEKLGTIDNTKIKNVNLKNKFNWIVTGAASTNCTIRFSGMINKKTNAAITSGTFSIAAAGDGSGLFTGPKGPDGNNGTPGPQGPAGPAGPQGVAGPAGAAGPQGPPPDVQDIVNLLISDSTFELTIEQILALDETFETDIINDLINNETFISKTKGPKGDKGDTGAQGPAGPAGAKGNTGNTGAAGPQGPAGTAGAQGPAGPAGAVGPQGPVGASAGVHIVRGHFTMTSNKADHYETLSDASITADSVIVLTLIDPDGDNGGMVLTHKTPTAGSVSVHCYDVNGNDIENGKFDYLIVNP